MGDVPVNGLTALPVEFSNEARSPAGSDGSIILTDEPSGSVYSVRGDRVGCDFSPAF